MPEKLSFELSREGRIGYSLPESNLQEPDIEKLVPGRFIRKTRARLPELSEIETIRHFIALSVMNHHVDKAFYPLGSCTMKYNPKINEDISRLPGFANVHPKCEDNLAQGALKLMHELSNYLSEISGMAATTLQPAAGAHGELTGLMMIRAYHENQGNTRKTILIPDSAHGTNPASVTISGYEAIEIKSNADGLVDLDDLKAHLNEDTAALMLTNPNTLGFFEIQSKAISELIHKTGALLYMDGANLNALLGIVRPGDLGFDVLHFNLHKTFSTPHGGGGPGSGPVGVSSKLIDFLPNPEITLHDGLFKLSNTHPKSVGKVATFYGNFAVFVKAYSYIRMLGSEGLSQVSQNAIINANYLLSQLKESFDFPYSTPAMHEFVLSGTRQREKGVKTMDIAKRLLDFGFHAPTTYFPLIVREAIMVEPTETEAKQTLDSFIEALKRIAREVDEEPDIVRSAPTATPVSRLDDVKAAKLSDYRFSF
ncbi:aminomethyl-transferring glycine dehydrogenase subunit GcvPB [candidate division KSB1 bacterium]|nr:aminomethyl-transferring glycine dehydrogenase subunit GcvPB [candidate division KSB1 bacterium]